MLPQGSSFAISAGQICEPAKRPVKLLQQVAADKCCTAHFSQTRYIGVMAKTPTRTTDNPEIGVLTRTRPKTKKPSLYKVLMLNDDYTPMEFVVHVLEQVFSKRHEDAYTIMMHVHQKGVGVCGVYTYEVAETKVTQVMDLAQKNGHPLKCTMEKE
jgi:ATP-dependent Clp protease adaptor protein ClpS